MELQHLTSNGQSYLSFTCVGSIFLCNFPPRAKGHLPVTGASNPFPPCFDSLWPPDGAAGAPKTCDCREDLLVALKPDPFYPRNCNIATSEEADDSSFSNQTQSLGQECAPRACQNQGATQPDIDFLRTMDTWCFAFVFQKRKKKKEKPLENKTCNSRYSIFSQISPSALLPDKRGDRKRTGKGVSALREETT